MRNILRILKYAMRSAAILATALIGTTYFFVGSAIAGAADDKKEVVVKPEVIHVIVQVKDVKIEPVVKEVRVEPKATSDVNNLLIRNVNNPFIRVNPFFVRPFLFDEEAFFFEE